MNKILIVGGGAAGMMAAIIAAREGASVLLVEKNEKLGKKLFITGKGRCNVTNACERAELFNNVTSNGRFLYSAFESFDNAALMHFFEDLGLKLKIERGKRVFPESDKSSDVIKALKEEIERLKIEVRLNTTVKGFEFKENICLVTLENNSSKTAVEKCDSLIIATGGISYASTGSTGDGYRFAKQAGHSVTPLVPSLVGIETEEDFPEKLQGLSLKNVTLTLENEKGKKIYSELGEMLFTHYGISGPLVLSASSLIADAMAKKKNVGKMWLDLKPGMNIDELNARLLKDFSGELNKAFRNSLDSLLPQSMIPVIVELSGIAPDKKVNSITKEERQKLVELLKHLEITFSGLRDFNEAIITKGGVSVKEVNPKTMESKLCEGLYFAGEVLDLDAMTGGFNLQIAWSTGYAAGYAAAHKEGR
ncbi:MAG: NAD(P)/FAD-dependent oxidoreductase [Lachnospiraceae bacterium]|nr:NAD(P)/FAD-dependent oxidoreductase [Lachnospiraceae bacterium]